MNIIKLGMFGLSTNPITEITVQANQTIQDIANQNNVSIGSSVVTVNGNTLSPTLLDSTLEDLKITDGDIILVTVKRDGAVK